MPVMTRRRLLATAGATVDFESLSGTLTVTEAGP